ncbi:metal ABC transporter substrate-binding protein [Kosmotoga pacifica]|uniref:ABC transporter substrate-binding protein n=1 Tax=Kosmotoga pacifica TaxID=1330330 RepID=A0A0G2ZGA7_9BACT|nr:metal ABC transporter substrate-binding protein [Kosmotoga pacifica]AKI97838.1 hypothetical protein IX53_08475 [Kosmotoga pacifica]
MKLKRLLVVIGFLVIASFALALNIVTTINPYYLLIKEITAGVDDVKLIIEPGQNPHLYSPDIEDIRELSEADIIIANGFELESFMAEKLKWLEKSGKKVVYVSSYVNNALLSADEADKHVNPHIWLSLSLLTEYIIPGLTRDLAAEAPQNSAVYSANAEKLIQSLQEMHEDLLNFFKEFSGTKVLMSHPSFYYFFRDFGIETVPIFEGHGDEPTISELKTIIEAAKNGEFIAAFGEYQQNNRSTEIIIKESGIRGGELDPLGIGRSSFEELLLWNIEHIKETIYAR